MMQNRFSDLLVNIDALSIDELDGRLERFGAATFVCDDFDFLRKRMTALGAPYHHPHASDDSITIIESRRSEAPLGSRGFTRGGLFPHTDRSVAARPPGILAFWCEEADADGGDAVMVDGKALLEDWRRVDGNERIALLMDPTHFIITADGRSVRRPLLEQWGPTDYALRFRNDDGIHCSAPALASFRELLTAIEGSAMTFAVRRGVGYIIQNTRWLHGRLPFRGYRKCARLLFSTFGKRHRTFGTFRADALIAESSSL